MSASSAAAAGRSSAHRRIVYLLLTAAAGAALLSRTMHQHPPPQPLQQHAEQCHTKALVPPKHRQLFGQLLEREGATVGAELGVQRGWFANLTLTNWPSCKKYYLIDVWRQQENYVEGANVNNDKQQEYYEFTQQRLERFSDRTVFLRMFTSEAVQHVPDESLDWVYIDARHDYCGCWEDIVQWWPKVKPNGLVTGHDFITAAGVRQVHPKEDWALCANGTRHEGAVEGAVRDFAQLHGLTVAVTYAEDHPWRSWMIRKPARC